MTEELCQQDYYPDPDQTNARTKDVMFKVVKSEALTYTDLKGRFPQRSRRGNQYILVAYHVDGNLIWGIPIRNRTGRTILDAYKQLKELFTSAAMEPNTWIMDNEISGELI